MIFSTIIHTKKSFTEYYSFSVDFVSNGIPFGDKSIIKVSVITIEIYF